MGKKLAFFSLKISNENGGFEEVKLMLNDEAKIKDTKISDYIRCEGNWREKNNNKLLVLSKIELLKRIEKESIDWKNLRKYNDKKKEEKSLCLGFFFLFCLFIFFYLILIIFLFILDWRLKKECNNPNCRFRHNLKEGELERIEILKEKNKLIFNSLHENDPIDRENKQSKTKRNKVLAEFIVNTFGIENLKKGTIFDVAGGKGLVR